MYIKEIQIDGFKSYAQRTLVSGFDRTFNAITGLNGSGKSNILDSICFVLGITNLTQVRASNLQELVYKNGQAGITKATVSVTFDNTDKNQSPVGYEQYDEFTVTRQVVVGGRNKYLINGTAAQNNRVADLFRSVQLNVNNPHFLIMQGRVTKVLNMKPQEILSMVEEAAGTKMYESKKQHALKTLENKEAKLAEIDKVLEEEITPTLNKLKSDRASYLEYQRLQGEIESLAKLTIAHEYVKLKGHEKNATAELDNIQQQIHDLEQTVETHGAKRAEIQKKIEELEARARQEASKSGDSLEKLEAELSTKQRKEIEAQAAVNHKQEALKAEEKQQQQLFEKIEAENKSLESKKKKLDAMTAAIQDCDQQAKRDLEEFEAAQRRIQALATGLTTNENGEEATLAAQLLAAKENLSHAETEFKQAELKLRNLRPQLQQYQTQKGQADADYTEARRVNDEGLTKIKKLEEKLANLNYDGSGADNLGNEQRQLRAEIDHLSRQVEEFEDSMPRLKFEYRDPTPNFDRDTVKGLVAKLIRLKDVSHATAIEVAAGDRLFNVIVDNEITGKNLLKNGQLKQRVTLIPLNKISGPSIRPDVVRKAKNLVGENNCHLALSLIEYPPELHRAMEYVFGNTFICTDMNVAKQVTFHPDIMKRTVTLRGEIFDPQGTLTGGSRKDGAVTLRRLQEISAAAMELQRKQQRKREIDDKLKKVSNSAAEWKNTTDQLAEIKRQVELAKSKLEGTSHHRQLELIRQTEEAINEAKDIIQRCDETKKKAKQRIAELEDRIRNADQYIAQQQKIAEQQLQDAKKRSEQSGKVLKDKEKGTEALKLEIQELEVALETYDTDLSKMKEGIESINKEIAVLTAKWNQTKEALAEIEGRVNHRREEIRIRSKDISDRQTEIDNIDKETKYSERGINQRKQDREKVTENARDAKKRMEQLASSYNWIRADERMFGQPGTPYDFAANNPNDATKRLQNARERKEKLQRTVNMRAMQMLARAEQQYTDLSEKREKVRLNKADIEKFIRRLDDKKREAIENAWAQVNRDFGSIFSTLLPGAKAKLEPPVGQTPLDGLEVRVGFGDVWKESLAELSGGQRSLVALSLILAMLLFKPAPIYILDEVDAALDLSHTQNIGQMLKAHFKHSQFIVVSLKDGMFNNANVLYRTKFVDGCSTVTRHTQSQ